MIHTGTFVMPRLLRQPPPNRGMTPTQKRQGYVRFSGVRRIRRGEQKGDRHRPWAAGGVVVLRHGAGFRKEVAVDTRQRGDERAVSAKTAGTTVKTLAGAIAEAEAPEVN